MAGRALRWNGCKISAIFISNLGNLGPIGPGLFNSAHPEVPVGGVEVTEADRPRRSPSWPTRPVPKPAQQVLIHGLIAQESVRCNVCRRFRVKGRIEEGQRPISTAAAHSGVSSTSGQSNS